MCIRDRGRKVDNKSQEVAIKVLDKMNIEGNILDHVDAKPDKVAAVFKEISTMYTVQSPYTVKILEIEKVKEGKKKYYCIVMESMKGSLKDLIK